MGNKLKKILVVSYDFPPRMGGIATCADKLATTFAKQDGTVVKVIAPSGNHELFDSTRSYQTSRLFGSSIPKVSFFTFLLTIIYELAIWQPTIVINLLWFPDGLSTWLALKILFWKRVPYYVFAHAVEVVESELTFRKRTRRRLSFLKKWTFQGADKIFAVSDFTKRLVVKNCGVSPENVIIVNNGVDTKEFFPTEKPVALEKKFNIKDKSVFFSVSRLCDYKGVDQALKAFYELKKTYSDFCYLIGGAGPDEPRLRKLTQKYGLEEHVIFLGKVPDSELNKYYNLCDCFILLSRADIWTPNVEGFGIVFLEAAACGKPVIAGNSGGVPDAVENNKSGWIVNPRDTRAILEKMRLVINDSDSVKELKVYARNRAGEFTWQRVVDRVLENTHYVRD